MKTVNAIKYRIQCFGEALWKETKRWLLRNGTLMKNVRMVTIVIKENDGENNDNTNKNNDNDDNENDDYNDNNNQDNNTNNKRYKNMHSSKMFITPSTTFHSFSFSRHCPQD